MIYVLSAKLKHEFGNTSILSPKEIASSILKWSNKNIPDNDLYIDANDDSYGRENNIHITVKFGIHTSDPKEIERIVKNYGPVKIKLKEIDKFKSEKYDVLIVNVESPDLHKLNNLISNNTKCTDTHPKYIPHLTLAYVKKGLCDNLVGNDEFLNESWESNKIEFSSKSEKKHTLSLI